MSKILVVAEAKGGEVRKPTLEQLSKARALGWEADAVLVGSGVKAAADMLAGHGAKTVYAADDAALANFALDRHGAAVLEAIEKSKPGMVWLSTSEAGKALAPYLAAKTQGAFVSDVLALEEAGGQITARRPAMATKVVQVLRFKGAGLKVLTIRGGAFDLTPSQPASATVAALAIPPGNGKIVVKEVRKEGTGQIDLGEARMIVSVGRGVKGPEGVELVRPLAQALGAAIGSSRAVVDSGWLPYEHQVGQTGRVVAPDVYFAIGISGAIQHLAGMSGSKLIVAVNKDPEAPIFSVADYGIVGDLFKVVPVLLEEVKKHRG